MCFRELFKNQNGIFCPMNYNLNGKKHVDDDVDDAASFRCFYIVESTINIYINSSYVCLHQIFLHHYFDHKTQFET